VNLHFPESKHSWILISPKTSRVMCTNGAPEVRESKARQVRTLSL
jgi:hypothetical protein